MKNKIKLYKSLQKLHIFIVSITLACKKKMPHKKPPSCIVYLKYIKISTLVYINIQYMIQNDSINILSFFFTFLGLHF